MLRLYKPIKHDIFKLQAMLKHLVCSVWCEANAVDSCESKLDADFEIIYLAYGGLKTEVDEIYMLCQPLNANDKKAIKEAFESNNKIKELCNGTVKPIYLNNLPDVVEQRMKPLLVDFYKTLLEKAKVPGTKKDYYEKLISSNEFRYCPCCGLTDIEQEDSKNREAFDHYLPKSDYPFASVNFENLVPLCHKCNSDRKGAKDPILGGRKAFYPFSADAHEIGVRFVLDKTKDFRSLERLDLTIEFAGDEEKIRTWNSLFDISDRYNDMTRSFSKTHLRMIKRRHQRFAEGKTDWMYTSSLDELIADYENDKYDDKKFLKIPFMTELKSFSDLIEVYGS